LRLFEDLAAFFFGKPFGVRQHTAAADLGFDLVERGNASDALLAIGAGLAALDGDRLKCMLCTKIKQLVGTALRSEVQEKCMMIKPIKSPQILRRLSGSRFYFTMT
jgi:hypothetical protein